MSDPEADRLVLAEDGLARPPWAAVDPLLQMYYDEEWGAPVHGERELFERISLEAFQSGLRDVERLLGNAGIVRNERKFRATIANAKATVALRDDGGLDRLRCSR